MANNATKAINVFHQPDDNTRTKYIEDNKIPATSICTLYAYLGLYCKSDYKETKVMIDGKRLSKRSYTYTYTDLPTIA
jgi:hypothetical protein